MLAWIRRQGHLNFFFVEQLFQKDLFNPLSVNPTKWSNTLKQFVGNLPTNCLSVFDHFVGLALKVLKFWLSELIQWKMTNVNLWNLGSWSWDTLFNVNFSLKIICLYSIYWSIFELMFFQNLMLYRAYSRPLLGATITSNLVVCVLKKKDLNMTSV